MPFRLQWMEILVTQKMSYKQSSSGTEVIKWESKLSVMMNYVTTVED